MSRVTDGQECPSYEFAHGPQTLNVCITEILGQSLVASKARAKLIAALGPLEKPNSGTKTSPSTNADFLAVAADFYRPRVTPSSYHITLACNASDAILVGLLAAWTLLDAPRMMVSRFP